MELAPGQDRRVLLFDISGVCPYCQASLDSYLALAQQAAEKSIALIWLSRDRLRDMATSPMMRRMAGAPGIVAVEPTHKTYLFTKVSVVPQVALLNEDWKVQVAVSARNTTANL